MIVVEPTFNLKQTGLMNLIPNTQKGIRKGFYFIGKDLVKESRRLMRQPKSGKSYLIYVGRGGKRLKKPRIHIASAKGEAPAIITGDLFKSVDFKVHNHDEVVFGANTPYAKRLEVREGLDRPYLKPAITNEQKNTILYLKRNIVKSLNAR
jgi:hypothetical protein